MSLAKSPDRGSFNRQGHLETLKVNPENKDALEWLEYYEKYDDIRRKKEQEPEWQKDNLEYDLRSSEYIIDKVKGDVVYAQNLYAALCNTEYQRNDTWPILTDKRWSCSWRYAGGIIADIREEGDYIDWYCSGIRNKDELTDDEVRQLSEHQQKEYLESLRYVSESIVTDEVKEDLFKLGWVLMPESNDYS
jgi:hypothetical protein